MHFKVIENQWESVTAWESKLELMRVCEIAEKNSGNAWESKWDRMRKYGKWHKNF